MSLMTLILPFFLFLTTGHGEMKNHHTDSGFVNPYIDEEGERGFSDFFRWQWERIFTNRLVKPDSYDLKRVPPELVNPPERIHGTTLTWVGHATYLIQMENLNILTDPVWSDRVGPFNNRFGPRRYMPPGVPWEKLPPIDVVIISHNHYDHMDKSTIERLENDFSPVFFVPLENKKFLVEWGVEKIVELDWWESGRIAGIDMICTPAQHFSQRWMNDRNKSLWSSWVIKGENATVFFGGDTGYFPGFSKIGERYGPIDIALMPIGAYEPRWFMKPVHVNPAEALQAYIDLEARYFAAMHWGTFDQSDELLDQPPKDLMIAADSLGVNKELVWVFAFGETRSVPSRPLAEDR